MSPYKAQTMAVASQLFALTALLQNITTSNARWTSDLFVSLLGWLIGDCRMLMIIISMTNENKEIDFARIFVMEWNWNTFSFLQSKTKDLIYWQAQLFCFVRFISSQKRRRSAIDDAIAHALQSYLRLPLANLFSSFEC